MTNLSHLWIKLPWYSDEYLYSLQERFPEIVGHMTRQELFKVLYENVDRESPQYEKELDLAVEVYEEMNTPSPKSYTNNIQNFDDGYFFQSQYDHLFGYLFDDLPKVTSQRLKKMIIESVENLSSAYLVLGHFDSTLSLGDSWFTESHEIYHLSFVPDQGLGQCADSFKNQKPLLALSVVLEEGGFIVLDLHLIRRYSDGTRTYIQNKPIDFHQFVELFNQANLSL